MKGCFRGRKPQKFSRCYKTKRNKKKRSGIVTETYKTTHPITAAYNSPLIRGIIFPIFVAEPECTRFLTFFVAEMMSMSLQMVSGWNRSVLVNCSNKYCVWKCCSLQQKGADRDFLLLKYIFCPVW